MSERLLITKLTRTGNTADLYARGHRWPDLKLFDLSDLLDVGIEFETLAEGVETPCRFWAHYEYSEKLNSKGNPYRNVIALEAMDRPATTTSTDNSAILAELRAIRQLLEDLAHDRKPRPIPVSVTGHQTAPPTAPSDLDQYFPRPDAPPDAKIRIPAGDYQGHTLGSLLQTDRDYLQRIAQEANDLHLRNAAATVLDWSRLEQPHA